jgi:hypothetical protein
MGGRVREVCRARRRLIYDDRMPDVVELARALVKELDEHALGEPLPLPDGLARALDAMKIELERIDALRASPPEPGSLDAALLAQVERVRGQGS